MVAESTIEQAIRLRLITRDEVRYFASDDTATQHEPEVRAAVSSQLLTGNAPTTQIVNGDALSSQLEDGQAAISTQVENGDGVTTQVVTGNAPNLDAAPVLEPVVDYADRITSAIRAASSGAPCFDEVRPVVVGPSGREIPPPPAVVRSSKRRKAVAS